MVTRIMHCKKCGREVVRTFPTEERAKHCTYVHCDQCKADTYERGKRKTIERKSKRVYVGIINTDSINQACDNFFRKRDIKLEQPSPIPFMKEDTSKAVSYGESAARRYMNMKGKKHGN